MRGSLLSAWGSFWTGQWANPAKRERRQLLKTIGRRQLLKRIKAERRRIKDVANG
jgi:hypothetical protein